MAAMSRSRDRLGRDRPGPDRRGYAVALAADRAVDIPAEDVEGPDELNRRENAMNRALGRVLGSAGDLRNVRATGADRIGDSYRVGITAGVTVYVTADDPSDAMDRAADRVESGEYPRPEVVGTRELVTDLRARISRGSVRFRHGAKAPGIDDAAFQDYAESAVREDLDGRTVGRSERVIGRVWYGGDGEVITHELDPDHSLEARRDQPDF